MFRKIVDISLHAEWIDNSVDFAKLKGFNNAGCFYYEQL
jgi:hypothetical protein